ncbi:MAG TPA: hypothetical protein VD793_10920, partial [Gemmatimonadales bacterium]|nr:hypothetical protein [Gemmatimonadales bacterium]
MPTRVVCLCGLAFLLGPAARAQLIPIKTVPVSQADQFAIFPSRNLGMGGLSIAVADPLLDPFTNPAKGSRLGEPYFFGSPFFYTVTSDAGGGRTLPLAAAMRTGSWFGSVAVAVQQVDAGQESFLGPFPAGDVVAPGPGTPTARSHGNELAFAMVGKVFPGAQLSVGGSAFYAGLSAIDGVDLLYARSAGIQQAGHAMDLRLGVLKEWEGDRSLEALLLFNQLRMSHDVTYLDPFWDPGTQQIRQRVRQEQNLDWTDIWGLHLEYERPLQAPGWRIGWMGTVNRMSHPKIPNYEIMNIPRDPGDSYAFNVGLGLARTRGPATFGIDVVYEPIWSSTWADAAGP